MLVDASITFCFTVLTSYTIPDTNNTDWIVREGGCLEVIREYQQAGRVKFIGFSTHGMTPLIVKAIETGVFDYVNLVAFAPQLSVSQSLDGNSSVYGQVA